MATTIDPQTTIGDLVTARPALARELERRGLDYCCGGAATLEDACARVNLDPSTVAAELGAVAGADAPAEWAGLGPARLADHIVATHHAYLWDEMPRVGALLDKVVGVHGARHPELHAVRERFAALRAELEPHLRKEEQVLFPMIRELDAADVASSSPGGSLTQPISAMLVEHDRAGEILAQLRACSHDYAVPADGCASYRACYEALEEVEADTHLHIHKENNRLFPAALDLPARREELR